VQFRKTAYGRNGVQEFLRDVLAMANASVDGARYIITGAEIDHKGRKRMFTIDNDDFSGKPTYQSSSTTFHPANLSIYLPCHCVYVWAKS
jgi:hypothetical protein